MMGETEQTRSMKLKRSAQLTLVGLVGSCQVLQRTLVALFSRPAVEYTFALRQLLLATASEYRIVSRN